ncbi:MAG: HD domain-containing protein, partial [Deltaproteobacteria bacterium]|nr:HD domain-containing protein [Deltaproteobacteria bacterium]
YIQQILLRALGSPAQVLKKIEAINDKFNRTKKIEVVSKYKSKACLRLHWHRDLPLSVDFCQYNQGIYSAIPTIWGLPPAQVIETECQFDGGEYCEFEVRWYNPSFYQRTKVFLDNHSSLLAQTIGELEQDKQLLMQKYDEVQGLNRRLEQRVGELLTIQQASSAILAKPDFAKLFPTVLELFLKETGYSRGLIMLVDEEREVLRYMDGVGGEPGSLEPLKGYEIPLSRTKNILVRVALTGRPLVVEDASQFNLSPDNVIIRNFNPQAFVLLPLTARGKIIGILAADSTGSAPAASSPEEDFLNGFANQVALAMENASMYQKLRDTFLSTIQALALAIEAKDHYTRGHSDRVTAYSVELARAIGLDETKTEQIRSMCLLHDIGKIGIELRILHKNGRLVGDEISVIRRHPLIGETIVQPLNLSPEEVSVVRNHHERFDGLGYPDGLKGEAVPLQVRVIALCDAYDAMTSDRPYRKALPVEEVLSELEREAGKQFDPQLVSVFTEQVRTQQLGVHAASEVLPPASSLASMSNL